MFGTNPVSLCLYFSARCCARQKFYELNRRKIVLIKLSSAFLKDHYPIQSFSSSATMRDLSNGTVKIGSIPEQNADSNNSHVCNGR